MQLISTALFSLAVAGAALASCDEASRFGTFSINATSDKAIVTGQVTHSYAGIYPKYIDYYLEVPENNNGHESPIILAHNEPKANASSDSFTVQIPDAPYWQANYSVLAQLTYPVKGEQGGTYYTTGGVFSGIKIAPTVSN
ncbi:hypothetical protein CONPUDRAFT_159572 [Coniophora puteana RWD-64-598 SS2]|uniref:Uncharacterized protein n=1 Tax=Coniophora puteana (strain RWD-64-598) TaxID=741705 RepID=A0A5M3M5Y5_CONPW|nr:uncharacterized protein CONPUDRAFT_159572 [Coniophora puteana RWD-64-598 SS2]EIW74792.1 hypothetical protein CONPUDRAFT_159572 [Coniophora puteana RWD-64-598 SS2]